MKTAKPGTKILLQMNDAMLWAHVTLTALPLHGTQRIAIQPIEPHRTKARAITLDGINNKIHFQS